ncbi:MAG TPA: gephyrin-like molybdotransferase Glp [Anaerolineaceae bacterium]|nr:gephyrin-like molybdotransferase Glp [Anaerolineaceae bacterium]
MPEFLQLLPPQEALARWLSAFPHRQPSSENIESIHSLGRIIAAHITAPHPLPAFPRSTVDGYAVRAADSYGASESLPAYFTVIGEVLMGCQPEIPLGPAQAALIHTGGMLPEGADAVVMVEYTQAARENEIEVTRAVAPLENILRVGEDVDAGQVVIPAGRRLRPAEIGGLMAFGIQTVPVLCQPRIAVLSTGDEVVPPAVEPCPGQVRDINSYSLSALIEEWGAVPVRYGIIPDRAEALKSAVAAALADCDALVITAGSSASSRDITAQVIQQAGAPGVLVHGVNVRPGKPTILGVCGEKPAIGLPGNPVSALVIAWLFVPAMIAALQGMAQAPQKDHVTARLSINVASLAGREDWIPVTLHQAAGSLLAEPVFFKSNLIFNLAGADGLMLIPADANGLAAGERIQVYRLSRAP